MSINFELKNDLRFFSQLPPIASVFFQGDQIGKGRRWRIKGGVLGRYGLVPEILLQYRPAEKVTESKIKETLWTEVREETKEIQKNADKRKALREIIKLRDLFEKAWSGSGFFRIGKGLGGLRRLVETLPENLRNIIMESYEQTEVEINQAAETLFQEVIEGKPKKNWGVEEWEYYCRLNNHKKVIFQSFFLQIIKVVFLFHLFLLWNRFLTFLGKWHEYDLIIKEGEIISEEKEASKGSLFLGRIPLAGREKTLIDKENIQAVFAIVENHENHIETGINATVKPNNWLKKDVLCIQVNSPDFAAINLELVQKTVEEIKSLLALGKNVYVHCKAGRGRSAQICIAFLMITYGLTLEKAFEWVKSRRKNIVKMNKEKRDILNQIRV